jgi:hypothetical protein
MKEQINVHGIIIIITNPHHQSSSRPETHKAKYIEYVELKTGDLKDKVLEGTAFYRMA